MRPPGFPALLCLVGWCVTLFGNHSVSWSKAHRRFDGGGPRFELPTILTGCSTDVGRIDQR